MALGESVAAVGVAAAHGRDVGVALAAVLGLAVAALWWPFGDGRRAGRQAMAAVDRDRRTGLALTTYYALIDAAGCDVGRMY